MSLLPQPFPNIDTSRDYNPAIRLFGNRFIKDQTMLEYMVELLAMFFSPKWIGEQEISTPLPSLQQIRTWPNGVKLKYQPPIKLNLKLLAFLGSSRIDGRHIVHEQQYKKLHSLMEDQIQCNYDKQKAIEFLEEFISGFQGVGLNRTWCAQAFYPISSSLITQETIWNETVARKNEPLNWSDSVDNFHNFYSRTKRNFMARGGEMLYLQLCNVFRSDEEELKKLATELEFKADEANLEQLFQDLQEQIPLLQGMYTESFDRLVDFLESLDSDTYEQINQKNQGLFCQWCPQESWPEGYMFAVELKRLLSTRLDPIDRLELLMTGCSLQVLRSLSAQSVRYSQNTEKNHSPLGYAWIFSSSNSSQQQRRISHRNLQSVQGVIQNALRTESLQENAKRRPKKNKDIYREADESYGHKLFLSLGKKMGIIAPYKGRGARFIMTDKLLRYLVVVLLQPGERITYQEFLQRMYMQYGIAIEREQLEDAIAWSGLPANTALQFSKNPWLANMLRAGGFLTELSDAWSIVDNTFGIIE